MKKTTQQTTAELTKRIRALDAALKDYETYNKQPKKA
jgi:hypothetical protein